MKLKKTSFLGILIISCFMIQTSSAQGTQEIRYSHELEIKDKFYWVVDNYLDDGIEVTQQQNYFGKIIDDVKIDFTVVDNPSSENIFTYDAGDLTYMLNVFKMVVGPAEISLQQNIGILQFLVMPTRYTINNTETKNFIHYYFKEVLGGQITTDGDYFDITVENVTNYTIHVKPVNIEEWTIRINRQTGILENMGLIANSEGNNFEINISSTTGGTTKSRFPLDPTFVFLGLVTLVLSKKKINSIR